MLHRETPLLRVRRYEVRIDSTDAETRLHGRRKADICWRHIACSLEAVCEGIRQAIGPVGISVRFKRIRDRDISVKWGSRETGKAL